MQPSLIDLVLTECVDAHMHARLLQRTRHVDQLLLGAPELEGPGEQRHSQRVRQLTHGRSSSHGGVRSIWSYSGRSRGAPVSLRYACVSSHDWNMSTAQRIACPRWETR